MSLVNDMLRDLNKRSPVSNKAARVHGTINSSIENKRPRIKVGMILAGGLLLGLGVSYLYFESTSVPVVEVPLALVPSQLNPAAVPPATPGAVVAEPPANAGQTVTVNASAPATQAAASRRNIVEIMEQSIQPNGFTLRIKASAAVAFDVLDRSTTGLTLHLDGIDDYARENTTLPGMSVLLVSNGLDIGIELDDPADFLVREDPDTEDFDILLTASYRPGEVSAVETRPAEQLVNADAALTDPTGQVADPALASEFFDAAEAQRATPAPDQGPSQGAPAPQPDTTAPSSERPAAVRTNREMSLEDRDRNNSQAALTMVQGARIGEADARLRTFLEENPTGHESRETLAKLLLAQREYVQAGEVIDEGLRLAPNFAAFKKIKARLLMQAGDPAQALALMRNVPPTVAKDTEYHELLARLYQQGNFHDLAVSTYQDLLRIDRQQGRWWTGLAISLEALGKNSDALASYKAALQTANLEASLRQYIQNRIVSLSSQQ